MKHVLEQNPRRAAAATVHVAEDEPGDVAIEELLRRAVEWPDEVLEARVQRIDVLDVEGVVADAHPLACGDGDVADVVRSGELLVALGLVGAQHRIRRDMILQHRPDMLEGQPRQDLGAALAAPIHDRHDRHLPARQAALHGPIRLLVLVPPHARRPRVNVGIFLVPHPFSRALARLAHECLVGLDNPGKPGSADLFDRSTDLHPPTPRRHLVDAELAGGLAARERRRRQHVPDEGEHGVATLCPRQAGAMGRVEGPPAGAATPALKAALARPPTDDLVVLAVGARGRVSRVLLDRRLGLGRTCALVRVAGHPLQLLHRHQAQRLQDAIELGRTHQTLPRGRDATTTSQAWL